MGPRAKKPGNRFIESVFPKPKCPTDVELRGALRHFRQLQPLCFVEGFWTNEGWGISASFNPVTYPAMGGADMIEICLKTAAVRFTPPSTEGWSWCESIKQFARENSVTISHKAISGATEGTTTQAGVRTQAAGEAQVHAPLIGKFGFSLQQELSASGAKALGTSEVLEQATTVREDHVEQLRDHKGFELRLTSPGGQDLVRLNGDLNRLSVLSTPEPASLDPKSVSVTLSLRLSGSGNALEHSLEIRAASGSWAALKSNRNKQVIAELLLSKFLQPLHKPVTLWPPKGELDG